MWRKLLRYCVLITPIGTGVIMAQPPQAVSAEKPAAKQVTQKDITALQVRYNALFSEARDYAEARERHTAPQDTSGNYISEAAAKKGILSPLIAMLKQINDNLRPFNPQRETNGIGKNFIDITISATKVPDTVTLDAIDKQAGIAFRTVDALLSVKKEEVETPWLPPETPSVAGAKITKKETVVALPPPVIARPETIRTAPLPVQTLTEAQRDLVQTIIDNTAFIAAASTVNSQTRANAKKIHDELVSYQKELAIHPANAAAVAGSLRCIGDYDKYARQFATPLAAMQKRRTDAAIRDAQLKPAEATELERAIYTDLARLQRLIGETASASIRTLAQNVANLYIKVPLLAGGKPFRKPDASRLTVLETETPAGAMYGALNEATDRLEKGDTDTSRYVYAKYIYEREQAGLAQRAQTLIQVLDRSSAALKSAPSRADLTDAESAYGIITTAKSKKEKERIELERFYHTSQRGVHNGREDLELAVNNRRKQITNLLNNFKGNLSYTQVSDLEMAIEVENREINALMAMWSYTNAMFDKVNVPMTERLDAWKEYATAAAVLADPNPATAFNPYASYSKELRNFLISQYRVATGDTVSSEQNVMAALMRNPIWKYQDALFDVYRHAYKLAPVNEANESAINAIGTVRAARILYENDYKMLYAHIKHPSENIIAGRLEDAEFILRHALEVVKPGAADDVLAVTAEAWLNYKPVYLKAETDAGRDGRVALADNYWKIALDILAIREAELWAANRTSIGNTKVTGADVTRAQAKITAAKQEFRWAFSRPETNGAYYRDFQRTLADDAIHIFAPAALASTEVHARYEVIYRSGIAKKDVTDVRDEAAAKKVELSFEALRGAERTDRNAAWAAAVKAEAGYIRVLSDPAFTGLFAPAEVNDAYFVLSPNVARKDMILATHRPRTTVERADQNSNQANAPHQATEVENDPLGAVNNELSRQEMLATDTIHLQPLPVDVLREQARAVSLRYGTNITQQEQLRMANAVLMKVYDARIKELETALKGSVSVVDSQGKEQMVPIVRFAKSDNPRKYFVVRAQQALEEAHKLREQYMGMQDQNLYKGQVSRNPQQAIMSVEQAIPSLSNINFPPPPPEPMTKFVVTDVAITRDLRTSGEYVSACPINFSITDATGTFNSAEYAEKYPDRPLRFNYFWYERYNERYYVRNPKYEKTKDPADLYIGVVMNNVITTDGKNMGRALVRVKATGLTATHGAAFREITEADGRVKPENVLYRVGKRDEPIVDDLLYRNLDAVCYVVPATLKDVAVNIAALTKSGGGDAMSGSKSLKLQSPAASSVSKYGEATHAALLVTPALLPTSQMAAETPR